MTDSKPTKPTKPTEAAKDTSQTKPSEKPQEAKPEVLSLRQQKDLEMQNQSSPLRNQDTVEDIVDHQLLTNAPATTIAAMTGWSLKQLAARAEELETTLKGSLAGDFRPQV